MENGKESAESYILRRLGIYEYPYLKGDFNMDLIAYCYNFESGSKEPLIEPWTLNATIKKALPNSFANEGIITIGMHLSLNQY